MVVLRPVKVVITNYPEGQSEEVDVINNPEDPSAGTRKVVFSRELFIERDDFREDPPKGYRRLSPGGEQIQHKCHSHTKGVFKSFLRNLCRRDYGIANTVYVDCFDHRIGSDISRRTSCDHYRQFFSEWNKLFYIKLTS